MTLPRIQPIAPTWRKEPVDDPDWLFDLNYDGFRELTYIDPGRNRLISRNRHFSSGAIAVTGFIQAQTSAATHPTRVQPRNKFRTKMAPRLRRSRSKATSVGMKYRYRNVEASRRA